MRSNERSNSGGANASHSGDTYYPLVWDHTLLHVVEISRTTTTAGIHGC